MGGAGIVGNLRAREISNFKNKEQVNAATWGKWRRAKERAVGGEVQGGRGGRFVWAAWIEQENFLEQKVFGREEWGVGGCVVERNRRNDANHFWFGALALGIRKTNWERRAKGRVGGEARRRERLWWRGRGQLEVS